MTWWKSKIGVISGVINSTESESEESERFHFLPTPLMTPSLMIQWKLDCRSRKEKRKNQPITMLGIHVCDWFIHPLLLPTPTMQFSLDRKRRSHKRNGILLPTSTVWFSLDRIALRFWLLLRLQTPSPVKTSLKNCNWVQQLWPWRPAVVIKS